MGTTIATKEKASETRPGKGSIFKEQNPLRYNLRDSLSGRQYVEHYQNGAQHIRNYCIFMCERDSPAHNVIRLWKSSPPDHHPRPYLTLTVRTLKSFSTITRHLSTEYESHIIRFITQPSGFPNSKPSINSIIS